MAAPHEKSVTVEAESNEFFKTALQECLDLSIDEGVTDEYSKLSLVTNKVLSPISSDFEPNQGEDLFRLLLPQECAKEYFQCSTPKRSHPTHQSDEKDTHPLLLMRMKNFSKISDNSEDHSSCNTVQDLATAASTRTSATATRGPVPVEASLSLILREHRRQLILSPFSQCLKAVIERQESAKKRQRSKLSKKTQRTSLRI